MRGLLIGRSLASWVAVCGLAGCFGPSDTPLIKACEIALKGTLLAPATYRRISAGDSLQDNIPLEEYLRASSDGSSVKEFWRKSGAQPVRVRALLEYDAANAYGTPIRSKALCSYETISADGIGQVTEHTVKVNGKTTTDRLIDAVRR